MSGQSLGLIETVGLTVAVEAADAAIKSANVELVGYELTKGGGLVTVKLTGEVGAMNAAVSAGVAAAGRVGQVYAWKVIARTASGIDRLIASAQTCGTADDPAEPATSPESPVEVIPAAAIPVVNLEPVTESVSCLDLEESLSDVSASAPEERALAEEKKTARPRGKSTRR
ncbi:BMC domain-containing protein [Klebsiella sp. R445]